MSNQQNFFSNMVIWNRTRIIRPESRDPVLVSDSDGVSCFIARYQHDCNRWVSCDEYESLLAFVPEFWLRIPLVPDPGPDQYRFQDYTPLTP